MTDLNQFVKDAIRTESRIEAVEFNHAYLLNLLKVVIAAGNLLDMVKKNVFYGKEIDLLQHENFWLQLHVGISKLDPHSLSHKEHVDIDPRVFHSIVGIATESTELVELLRNAIVTGEFDNVNFNEEMGDLNWYEAIGVDATDGDLAAILRLVIEKLQLRFPEKFTSEHAIDRDVDAERKLLENRTK